MKACSDYRGTLVLDVYRELSPEEQAVWEKHLAGCDACRKEKDILAAMVQSAREAGASPDLSSEEEQFLSGSIQHKLKMPKTPVSVFKGGNWWLAPAVAACMILVFAGWMYLKDFRSSDKTAYNAGNEPDEEIIIKNAALLENMELLQEMEDLEKLVKMLDDSQNGSPVNERESKADYVYVRV